MRSDAERLEDSLEMCRNLGEPVAPRVGSLDVDPVLTAAAQRWIEILGEAASGLSERLRAAHSEVPWRGVIGMRTILAHGYFHLDLDLIRAVVERDAPDLERQVEAILKEMA
jgi:uncharacterized protein with HEPN domain